MFLTYQKGSSLVEALVALLILSFVALGTIGLQSNLLKVGSQSRYRLEASMLARNISGMIAVDAANVGCYALGSTSAIACLSSSARSQAESWRAEVMATLPNAVTPSVAVGADRVVTVTLSWKPLKDATTRNLITIIQPPA
jgi:type IV pilus assembly protein PilV